MKLNKEEWNKLDNLLRKIGFGGYYDFLECLKISINDINDIYQVFNQEKIQELKDLSISVKLLNKLTNINRVKILDLFEKTGVRP